MVYASLDVHSRLRDGLRELGCSPASFAAIAGISQDKISRAFRGVTPFSNIEGVRLERVLKEMRELRDSGKRPVWTNVNDIREALKARRAVKRELKEAFSPENVARAKNDIERNGFAPSLAWNESLLSHCSLRELLLIITTYGIVHVIERIEDEQFRNQLMAIHHGSPFLS